MSTRGARPRQAAKPCTHCNGPHGPDYCLTYDFDAAEERRQRFLTRAAAHTLAEPRAAQRWMFPIKDEDVAALLYGLEADEIQAYRIKSGRWVLPLGARLATRRDPSTIINEAIRTGLVRHLIEWNVDYLIPALVHYRDGGQSACRFTGEDLGPMRARLVDDLSLVDCLECEAVIARGHPRGL